MKKEPAGCARCPIQTKDRLCQTEDGKSPAFCPTQNYETAVDNSLQELRDPDVLEFARQASIQEAEGYAGKDLGRDKVRPVKPRIVETLEFAKRMNYKRLGLAFCSGLIREAKVVEKILSSKGFEVVSAICKVGRIPKEKIGVLDHEKIAIGKFEPMCNPILQALVLNDAKTDFNMALGLCVGHDSLFFKYSEAPCTVLAAKDRVLGHNPLAAIYNIDSYYRSLKK